MNAAEAVRAFEPEEAWVLMVALLDARDSGKLTAQERALAERLFHAFETRHWAA